MSTNLDGIARGAYVYSRNGLVYMYGFTKNKMWVSATTNTGATTVALSSTIPDYTATDKYNFQIDGIFDATGGAVSKLIVHGQTNLGDIADETDTNIYMCDAGVSGAALTKLTDGLGNDVKVSGGIVVLQPYVFAYGNAGLIKNSNANNPNDWRIGVGYEGNEVNVSGTKIVKGLPLRGGSTSPAGLFWSLDRLIRVYKQGNDFK